MKTKTYQIPRSQGWEPILETLVRKITGVQQGDVKAACNYNSELFIIRPYYIGTCTCSYLEKMKSFEETHPHHTNCFHSQWDEIHSAFKNHPKYSKFNIYKTERINMENQLCRKFGIKYNSKTISKICTCSVQDELDKLNLIHEENCKTVLPNFEYRGGETTKIWWYKTFFRDAYCNREITMKEFKEIVSICLDFVNHHPSSLVYTQ
jgi:hypothetical protein